MAGGLPPLISQCLARGGQAAESAEPERRRQRLLSLLQGPLRMGSSPTALKERLPTRHLHSHERKGETLSLCLEPQGERW